MLDIHGVFISRQFKLRVQKKLSEKLGFLSADEYNRGWGGGREGGGGGARYYSGALPEFSI